MSLDVKFFGDPILKSRASDVKKFDESLELLVEDMFDTMEEYEGAGLAGNQVGQLKRLFVAEFEEERYVLINPQITSFSDELDTVAEGCLSIPGFPVDVERPTGITLKARDVHGEEFELSAEGHLARIFQHEIDHLDGILILDRTDRESRKAALREMRERMLKSSRT